MPDQPTPEVRRTSEPETAALRALQVAMGEAQLALGRRMRRRAGCEIRGG